MIKLIACWSCHESERVYEGASVVDVINWPATKAATFRAALPCRVGLLGLHIVEAVAVGREGSA